MRMTDEEFNQKREQLDKLKDEIDKEFSIRLKIDTHKLSIKNLKNSNIGIYAIRLSDNTSLYDFSEEESNIIKDTLINIYEERIKKMEKE